MLLGIGECYPKVPSSAPFIGYADGSKQTGCGYNKWKSRRWTLISSSSSNSHSESSSVPLEAYRESTIHTIERNETSLPNSSDLCIQVVHLFALVCRTPCTLKAETHDATNRCDTSPRQVAATNSLVWQVKIIVAATEFCRSDKISASSLVAPCVRICDKSLRQNLNQPMRKHQLVSRHVKFELVYVSSFPKSITCTEKFLIAANCRRISADEGTCHRDVSQRFLASCVSVFR